MARLAGAGVIDEWLGGTGATAAKQEMLVPIHSRVVGTPGLPHTHPHGEATAHGPDLTQFDLGCQLSCL